MRRWFCVLLLLGASTVIAFADDVNDDPGIYLLGTTIHPGTPYPSTWLNYGGSGATAITSLPGFPGGMMNINSMVPFSNFQAPNVGGVGWFKNETGSTLNALYVVADEAIINGAPSADPSKYNAACPNYSSNSEGSPRYFTNCAVSFDGAGHVVFEYYGGSGIQNGQVFGLGANDSTGFYWDDVYLAGTPEPGSLVLLGSGLLALAGMLRRFAM